MRKVGFVVNPIAGMGGRVGLKGTDGMEERAKELGAVPVAEARARLFIGELSSLLADCSRTGSPVSLELLTVAGKMGSDALSGISYPPWKLTFVNVDVADNEAKTTTREDTLRACRKFIEDGAEIVVFCGGDGTARDVMDAVDKKAPILGVPSGVKMHSAVFGVDPVASARMTVGFLKGEKEAVETEVVDLDEEAYRMGEWRLKIHGTALVPQDRNFIQSGKEMFESVSEDEAREAIAEHVDELSREDDRRLLLLGPGSTMLAVKQRLGFDGTLLGVDAFERATGSSWTDLDEKRLLDLLSTRDRALIVLSPIGAQGFILGRGNLQFSPSVLKKVGIRNVLAVATPAKIGATPALRIDTGDAGLDTEFRNEKYVWVVTGFRLTRLIPLS